MFYLEKFPIINFTKLLELNTYFWHQRRLFAPFAQYRGTISVSSTDTPEKNLHFLEIHGYCHWTLLNLKIFFKFSSSALEKFHKHFTIAKNFAASVFALVASTVSPPKYSVSMKPPLEKLSFVSRRKNSAYWVIIFLKCT